MNNKDEILNFWIKSSDDDAELFKNLFENKHYVYSLFFVHLSIEKLLKGLIVALTSNPAPYEHNLVRLAELTKIDFTENQLDLLAEITAFNIKGRYDDYKNQFYKIATEEYTSKYLVKAFELIQWLKKHLPEK